MQQKGGLNKQNVKNQNGPIHDLARFPRLGTNEEPRFVNAKCYPIHATLA